MCCVLRIELKQFLLCNDYIIYSALLYLKSLDWYAMMEGYVLCLATGRSQVRIYLKPLHSDLGEVAYP